MFIMKQNMFMIYLLGVWFLFVLWFYCFFRTKYTLNLCILIFRVILDDTFTWLVAVQKEFHDFFNIRQVTVRCFIFLRKKDIGAISKLISTFMSLLEHRNSTQIELKESSTRKTIRLRSNATPNIYFVDIVFIVTIKTWWWLLLILYEFVGIFSREIEKNAFLVNTIRQNRTSVMSRCKITISYKTHSKT